MTSEVRAGVILALDMVAGTPRQREVDTFMDRLPALVAIATHKPQPGQHLIAIFHERAPR